MVKHSVCAEWSNLISTDSAPHASPLHPDMCSVFTLNNFKRHSVSVFLLPTSRTTPNSKFLPAVCMEVWEGKLAVQNGWP